MLSLMKGVFGPSTSYQDKIMYMNSLKLNHSIGSNNNANNPVCADTIFNLIGSKNTRYIGLQLLELALQQNSDQFYNKGKWALLSFEIIKESQAAYLEKVQACKILNLLMPYIANDSSSNVKDELIKDIYPVLLEKIEENVEWAEEACKCVKMCLRTFPHQLALYKDPLINVILHQASHNVSSKSFEVLAECFCEIPYCGKDNNADAIRGRWRDLYLSTLKTIESLQVNCLSHLSNNEESYENAEIEAEEFTFKEDKDNKDFFPAFTKYVRRFVNLCKCLAKLLSTKSRYSVKVPIQFTLKCLIPIYTSCRREKLVDSNEEILYTFIAQMQLAGLVVLESLIINCNLLKNAVMMRDFIKVSLESCKTTISSEPVSEVRSATWRLLSLWLEAFGRSVSKEIAESSEIIQELLKDINIDASESLQASNAMQTHNKSKKSASLDSMNKSVLKRKNQQIVCEAALNTLESLLYTGTLDFSKGAFQGICNTIFKICHTIRSSCDPFPFPYNDESCREKLYSVVLAIVILLKPDEVHNLQTAMIILAHMNNDPSLKVRKFSNKASVIYRLQLYPKRPLPVCSGKKQRRPNVSDERLAYPEWSTEEYDQNAENVSTSESANANVEQSFQNQIEVEVHSEEYMDVETHYPEQVVENQCNGEDILEIQSSSQCQDDVESDEEEEEDEEERSYGEEEMNQEEPQQEVYIPASRKIQISNPVQMNSETNQSINEPEYEELTPCLKSEENAHNSSNKDKCVNGEGTVMREEDMPSSSTEQTVTNENGIFGIDDDDDDLDEENEEEEEEESESYTSEKRDHYTPPLKKQKVETKDDLEVEERKERSKSPTLDEMKADFLELLPAIEDVRSGKVQLSTS